MHLNRKRSFFFQMTAWVVGLIFLAPPASADRFDDIAWQMRKANRGVKELEKSTRQFRKLAAERKRALEQLRDKLYKAHNRERNPKAKRRLYAACTKMSCTVFCGRQGGILKRMRKIIQGATSVAHTLRMTHFGTSLSGQMGQKTTFFASAWHGSCPSAFRRLSKGRFSSRYELQQYQERAKKCQRWLSEWEELRSKASNAAQELNRWNDEYNQVARDTQAILRSL